MQILPRAHLKPVGPVLLLPSNSPHSRHGPELKCVDVCRHWIQLWKSGKYWRTDRLYDGEGNMHGLLGSMAMACIFRDDGMSIYEVCIA